MKKAALYVFAVVMMVALCLPVFAQQFPDVPTDHWAYSAVQDLANKGIIQGYPDGTFSGKRALTRYEFAEALSKAIPVIAGMAGEGKVGPPGVPGEPGKPGTPGVGAEQLANLQRLIDEFKTELAAQGADIKALKADVAALDARVTAVEEEQRRVVVNGELNFIPRGFVDNDGRPFDRDGRFIGGSEHVLQNSTFNTDYQLSIKGRVSKDTSVYALVDAGNYMSDFLGATDQQFTLWKAYMDAGVNLGGLGKAQIQAGRMPFQLSPYVLKLVEPDSYAYVGLVSNGDFPLDGVFGTFHFLKNVSTTLFGAKSAASSGDFTELLQPTVQYYFENAEVEQLGGIRNVIDTNFGDIALGYTQMGLTNGAGRESIFSADVNAKFAKLGISASYANSNPSDALKDVSGIDSDSAWNAKLSYQLGSLGIGGGYSVVEAEYLAPGYWSRFGEAANLVNVKGPMANINYNFSKNLSLVAEGQWLEPNKDGDAVQGRAAAFEDATVFLGSRTLDRLDYWKAGLRYGLTARNSVDLGWEEVQWKPADVIGGDTTRERYVTIGLGHTFNPNASLKLLYQIIEYKQGALSPYGDVADYRGGVAAAQFQLKY